MMNYRRYLTALTLGGLLLGLASFVSDISFPANTDSRPIKQLGPGVKKQYLGANYNEFFEQIRNPELKSTDTKWIRGFFDFFEPYNKQSLSTDPRIKAYLALNKEGYQTVINIKFNFKKQKFPEKGSKEWDNHFEFLDKFLETIIGKTDVIIIGNEPFLEANEEDFEVPLNTFYAAVCEHVNQYLLKHNINEPIFIGAFLNNYLPKYQTKGVKDLLQFARSARYIAGIDVHIHHDADSDITKALDFLNDKIRDDQKIIISEFSLVARWRNI